ncbi:MAG TPA: arginase [Bryobacteraceae bacterium]|nr:arginase [Bryobacteraceae bacterium]
MMRQSTIAIIGAPLDLGAGRRGVDMGPSAIRVANIHSRVASLGYKVEDLGNVAAEQAESAPAGSKRARYLVQIAETCTRLAEKVERALSQGKAPLILGGDHSIAAGSVSGVANHFRKRGEKIGVLWVDAHTDMNTPQTSPSGNVHGMPLACLVGKGPKELTNLFGFSPKVDPRNVALVGVRDVDLLEATHVKKSGVRAFTMRDIDERGLPRVMEEALAVTSAGTVGLHLSFDMDSVDPDEAPGVGTPVRGGITYREAHLAMELVADAARLVSLEVVEVNPVLDVANRTADLAVELMMSALGKRIL